MVTEMITSGYLIGQIIDEFSALGEQAKLRNRLGLSDISVFSENFFCDILNIVEGYNLVNTNEDRANEPGVDLGDETKRIAFQVTTTKSSDKVKNTLKKITKEQLKKYDRFVVIILGDKQNSYEAVTTALLNRAESEISPDINFDPDKDIIDLTDLARKVIGLDLESIKSLHRLIRDQMSKVKIELQVPDQEGNYEVSGYRLWEALPTPKLGNGYNFAKWEHSHAKPTDPPQDDVDAAKEAIQTLSKRLHKLPRLTREFLAVLFERSEVHNRRSSDRRSLFLPTVERTYPDARSEIELLVTENLVQINTDPVDYDDHGLIPPEIELCMCVGYEGIQLSFYDFVIENNLTFRHVLVELDFSQF